MLIKTVLHLLSNRPAGGGAATRVVHTHIGPLFLSIKDLFNYACAHLQIYVYKECGSIARLLFLLSICTKKKS